MKKRKKKKKNEINLIAITTQSLSISPNRDTILKESGGLGRSSRYNLLNLEERS